MEEGLYQDVVAKKLEARIKLYTGGIINVLFPKVEDINIFDIAHALSCQARFSGHTHSFYSVAQHSVEVSKHVPKGLELCGLLHDATEAYLVDMPRPIKYATNMGDAFREIEDNLWNTIAQKFELPNPIPREVKFADSKMLRTEMRDLMGGVYGDFTEVEGDFPEPLSPMLPTAAEKIFLQRFFDLYKLKLKNEEWRLILLKINDPNMYWKETHKED